MYLNFTSLRELIQNFYLKLRDRSPNINQFILILPPEFTIFWAIFITYFLIFNTYDFSYIFSLAGGTIPSLFNPASISLNNLKSSSGKR